MLYLDTKIKVRHAKILFCGAPKTGKTTFLHRFKYCYNSEQSEKVIITEVGKSVDFVSEINQEITFEKRNNGPKQQKQDKVDTEKVKSTSCTTLKGTTWNVLTLQDISCQPELINVLPELNDSTTVSFVVLSISEGEDGLCKLIDTPGTKNYRKHKTKCTTKYLLKRLLASIKEFSNVEYTPETKQSENTHTVQSPQNLYFLGTIFDNLNNFCIDEDSVTELKYKVSKWIKILGTSESLKLDIHGYDGEEVVEINLKDSEETQNDLTQKIVSKVKTVLQSKPTRDLPVTWVQLEYHLHQQHKKICFSLDELKSLAQEIIPNAKEEFKLTEFLNFYHSFGTLLYFDVNGLHEYVITNPQLLRKIICKLVTCEFVEKEAHNIQTFNELRYKGIFNENLLDVMDLNSRGIKKEYFMKLLVYLKICAPYDNQYFIPMVLEPCGESKSLKRFGKMVFYKTEKEKFEVQPLLIKFEVNIIPRGMFCLLVAQLKNDNPDWELVGENDPHKQEFYRFSNMVTFCIDSYGNHYLSIIDKAFYLKIHATSKRNTSPPYKEAQKAVTKSLKLIDKRFGHHFSEIQYGFFCRSQHALEITEDTFEYTEDVSESPKHLSCIFKCENIEDIVCASCSGYEGHKMKLEEHHTVWFKVYT